MNKLDLKNINYDDMYVGDIYLIKSVNKEFIKEMKEYNSCLEDMSPFCEIILAKRAAFLVKVTDDYYVDFDDIKTNIDIRIINSFLESGNLADNNLFLTEGSKEPFVGRLFIKELFKVKKDIIYMLKYE